MIFGALFLWVGGVFGQCQTVQTEEKILRLFCNKRIAKFQSMVRLIETLNK
jgi:hypothetical protein